MNPKRLDIERHLDIVEVQTAVEYGTHSGNASAHSHATPRHGGNGELERR